LKVRGETARHTRDLHRGVVISVHFHTINAVHREDPMYQDGATEQEYKCTSLFLYESVALGTNTLTGLRDNRRLRATQE
jgi:hypothetical protein